jgi:hypothetical protein
MRLQSATVRKEESFQQAYYMRNTLWISCEWKRSTDHF